MASRVLVRENLRFDFGAWTLDFETVMNQFKKSNLRIAALALVIFALDQCTKLLVLHTLYIGDERGIIPGFFKFVHWRNTGAAMSLFQGDNAVLALVALLAFVALYLTRHHFDSHTLMGQVAFGLIFGGIAGNLFDRIVRHDVVDFIRFYLIQRNGDELGFPAFNVADSAICIGVGLIFLITWKNENTPKTV
jgi:signal peptidase II